MKKGMTIKKWYPQYTLPQRIRVGRIYKKYGKRSGMPLDAFLYYGMDRMTEAERKNIIREEELPFFDRQFNALEALPVFNDKREFYKVFHPYMNRRVVIPLLHGKEAFLALTQACPRFLLKPACLYGGKGMESIEPGGYNEKLMEQLYERMIKEDLIAEEWLFSAEEYAKIYDKALCTVRINTMLEKDGEVRIFAAANQFGSGESFVDNDEETGIWAAVNTETGIVFAVEKDWESAKCYEKHPDTGSAILGFQNPKWGEITALAKKAARVIPSCRWIGWDIAVTKEGRTELIEGNVTPEIGIWQAMTGQGLREYFEEQLRR